MDAKELLEAAQSTDGPWVFIREALHDFAREIRNQALEDAAAVCETWQHSRYETVMRIRAMKENSTATRVDTK